MIDRPPPLEEPFAQTLSGKMSMDRPLSGKHHYGIPSTKPLRLNKVHVTWTGTHVLEAATFLFPDINFILANANCIPVSLFQVKELIQSAESMCPEATRSPAERAELNTGLVSEMRTSQRPALPRTGTK